MNFQTHNDVEIDINGTSYQGQIEASYEALWTVFGEPRPGDNYKTDAEWHVLIDDDVIATIYNWKNGHNYCGPEGTPTEDITDWNIGGFSPRAAKLVSQVLEESYK